MAEKRGGFGGMLLFGAAAAVLGGVAAYMSRQSIEKAVQNIADQLEAREEDGFFSVDLGDERIIHATFHRDRPEEGDSDFVDAPGQAQDEDFVTEPAPEEPEEIPPEE